MNNSRLKYLKRTGSQWSINSLKADTLDIVNGFKSQKSLKQAERIGLNFSRIKHEH